MTIILNLLVLIIGGLLALQGVINARLSTYVNHPLQAAVISFFVGFTSLTIIAVLLKSPLPNLAQLRSIPSYLFIGGLLGAIMVSSAIVLIPKIGAASFIGGIIVGQLLSAVVLDHFGALGLPVKTLDLKRGFGVACLILGFLLTRK